MNEDLEYLMTKYDNFIQNCKNLYNIKAMYLSKQIIYETFFWTIWTWKKFREQFEDYYEIRKDRELILQSIKAFNKEHNIYELY
ncbi:MAG: hypothetical protein PQJ49_13960 [Sphaerochaetaceae bacterium]|nr:hypothetical protein [Sphaerochaetaceae bacterium]